MTLVQEATEIDAATAVAVDDAVLHVRNLTTEIKNRAGTLRPVNEVSFDVQRARALAVIGESGSGKSALLKTILGLQPAYAKVTGEVLLDGRDLLSLGKKERAAMRGRDIAMVFQDPLTALDPVFTVEKQLTETLRRHLGLGRASARQRALELLEAVHIPSPEDRLRAYPFELSGGMRQRVVIAMALACEPGLLLADEPTTALDVTVQAKVLKLIREIQQERRMSMILVTHDLAVAAQTADDVAVMYGGRLVECGPVTEVLRAPQHPYTRGLLEANVHPGQDHPPAVIPGSPPNLTRMPPGCAFAPRCPAASAICWQERPQPQTVGARRWAACHHTSLQATAVSDARVAVEVAG
jgi:oligopeptide/dipeptide ABC transporter ATP-binding protein